MEEVADLRHEDVDEEVGLLVIVLIPPRYRGASVMRKNSSLGPYGRTMPRARWGS